MLLFNFTMACRNVAFSRNGRFLTSLRLVVVWMKCVISIVFNSAVDFCHGIF